MPIEEKFTSPSDAIDEMMSMLIKESKNEPMGFSPNRFAKIDSLRRLAWNNTGPKQLESAKMSIFEALKSHFNGRYISVLNSTEKIWTISLNLTSKTIPLVLIHGFPEGVCLWSLNLDQLCSDRPIDAVDLPGFALNKEFILLGHSFVGLLNASYTLHHPAYVEQLVLIDPWRFGEKSEDIWQTGRLQKVPIWARSFSSIMMKVSPVTGLRVTGPFGVPIIKYIRSDFCAKPEQLFDDDRILFYLYPRNAQLSTGEQAFRTISDCFAWTIKDAGHHIYADAPIEFDMYLKRILFNKD